MTRRIMSFIKYHSFSAKSERRLYIALSAGILLSMLPLSEIKWILIPLLSLVLSLNLLLMLLGVALVTLLPMVHLLSYGIAIRLSPVPLADLSSKFLSLDNLVYGTPGGVPYLIGSTLAGIAISLAILPLYTYIHRRDRTVVADTHAIFHDVTGKRLNVVKRTRLLMAVVLPVMVLAMGFALNVQPALPDIELEKTEPYVDIPSADGTSPPVEQSEGDNAPATDTRNLSSRGDIAAEGRGDATNQIFAFYSRLDDPSRISLEENIGKIDIVVSDWFSLKEDFSVSDDVQKDVQDLMKKNGVRIMPQVQNASNGVWDPARVRGVINSSDRTEAFIRELVDRLKSTGSHGVTIDFESLGSEDRNAYTTFIQSVSEALHAEGLSVAVTLPAGEMEAYDAVALARHADYLLLLLYDEHYSTGAPGPVASQEWVEGHIDGLKEVPREKIVPVLGNYGYDWDRTRNEPARFMAFNEVIHLAREGDLRVEWHEDGLNPYFRYRKGDSEHEVWFLDGATLFNGMQHAISKGIPNIGLWALGTEDAGIWDYIDRGDTSKDSVSSLEVLKSSSQVQYTDEGDIVRIKDTVPKAGSRRVEILDGRIVRESYDTYPLYYEVEKYGKQEGKKVALTFDDGPNRKYTPRILDILSQYNAPSTFFVIGMNALSNQEIVERMYKEGHEIGNHSFTHTDTAKISDFRLKLELSLTQRVIQDIIGHSTLLFRPPGSINSDTLDFEDYLSLQKAQEMGYTVVGESIDPNDWARPTADEIHQKVMENMPRGNVMLLHDSGGNRENTVEALPRILEDLKAQGYEFVTVSSLIGKSREEIMPAVVKGDNHFVLYTKSTMVIVFGFLEFMGYVLLTTTVLGALRLLFLVYFSKKQHRSARTRTRDKGFRPSVSVVIAAYNEEKVIVSTVRSVLESTYMDLEIIVVNDGSTDDTSRVVKEAFGDNPKVVLLEKENGGKSSALNMGFKKASGEIVVTCDADTMLNREAVTYLVTHFADEAVGAVSGNVKVGNVHNLLTKWQYIEYVIGFNLERRAFAYLDCITVVPGAIGAWRKADVASFGYYKKDTLAEDTDMTITLLKHGRKVRYEERALAYTEAPSDLRSLMRQRYRWSYGILQSLWKHRDMLFHSEHRTLGYVALPNMWVYQYMFQTLTPLADLILLLGLFSSRAPVFIAYYLMLLALDYATAIYAFRLEREKTGILVWLFLQRIIYRTLMVYINLKAIFNALKGMQVGWNKLKRRGNAKNPKEAKSYS